jgi:hypothetical protein
MQIFGILFLVSSLESLLFIQKLLNAFCLWLEDQSVLHIESFVISVESLTYFINTMNSKQFHCKNSCVYKLHSLQSIIETFLELDSHVTLHFLN